MKPSQLQKPSSKINNFHTEKSLSSNNISPIRPSPLPLKTARLSRSENIPRPISNFGQQREPKWRSIELELCMKLRTVKNVLRS